MRHARLPTLVVAAGLLCVCAACGSDDPTVVPSGRGATGGKSGHGGNSTGGRAGSAGAAGLGPGGAPASGGTAGFGTAGAGTAGAGTAGFGAAGPGAAGFGAAGAATGGFGTAGAGTAGAGTGGFGTAGAGTGGFGTAGAGTAGAGGNGQGGAGPIACVPTNEICDGLDNDCDGVADQGLAGCEACAPHHELPVVTHWSNATQAPLYLASDAPTVGLPYPPGAYVPGTCYPVYTGSFFPDVDSYLGTTWSTFAIPDAEATSVLRSVCQATGVPVRLLRPDAVGTPRVLDRPGATQIIHDVIIDGSLATIVLPPNWSASAPAGSYPVVFNAFYDLNDSTFHGPGVDVTKMIALSATAGRTGAIGVLWNGGGTVATRTLNPHSLDQVAAVFDYVATHFSADKQRIVAFGISRGGGAALMAASNPDHHDYRVTFAAVAVPPTRIGEHMTLQSTTYPGLLDAVAAGTGHADSWRAGWTYPACANKPHLTGKTGPEAHLYVLTGTTDPAYADANLSLIAPAYVAGLKAAGTKVYLETGSHDFIVPYAHQIEYGLAIAAAGVPLEANILIRAGHAGLPSLGPATFGSAHVERAWQALQSYVVPANAGQAPSLTPGLSYFVVDRATKTLVPGTPPDGFVPFTLEGPVVAVHGHRFPLVLVGAEGTQWEISLTHTSAGTISWKGTIPSTLKSIQWVDVNPDVPVGAYAYALRILKPGAPDWKTIPATSSIDGTAASLTVVADEPNVPASQAAVAAVAPTFGPFTATTWGLSEY